MAAPGCSHVILQAARHGKMAVPLSRCSLGVLLLLAGSWKVPKEMHDFKAHQQTTKQQQHIDLEHPGETSFTLLIFHDRNLSLLWPWSPATRCHIYHHGPHDSLDYLGTYVLSKWIHTCVCEACNPPLNGGTRHVTSERGRESFHQQGSPAEEEESSTQPSSHDECSHVASTVPAWAKQHAATLHTLPGAQGVTLYGQASRQHLVGDRKSVV